MTDEATTPLTPPQAAADWIRLAIADLQHAYTLLWGSGDKELFAKFEETNSDVHHLLHGFLREMGQ